MKIIKLKAEYARALEMVPQALDKSHRRPHLVIRIGSHEKSLLVPFHTVSSKEFHGKPREWAVFYAEREDGTEYVDFRKSFLADLEEANGGPFELSDDKYDWVVRNIPNFKAVARDRVYNPGKIRDDYSIDLETFDKDLEKARQELMTRGRSGK